MIVIISNQLNQRLDWLTQLQAFQMIRTLR